MKPRLKNTAGYWAVLHQSLGRYARVVKFQAHMFMPRVRSQMQMHRWVPNKTKNKSFFFQEADNCIRIDGKPIGRPTLCAVSQPVKKTQQQENETV